MGFQAATKSFLGFLQTHPDVRRQIRAPHNRTLLYAGGFFRPMWLEIVELRRRKPELAALDTLPDVLQRITVTPGPFPSFLAYVQDVERQVPWRPDGFTIWRALSGIFAANASGAVSFQVGSPVTNSEKVFAATELPVLLRNPSIDATTRDLLAYFQRCVLSGTVNAGFIRTP